MIVVLIQAFVLMGLIGFPWLSNQDKRCTAELGKPAVYLPADGGCKPKDVQP